MPHLVSGSCSSPRAFALGFLPTPPRGDAVALPLAFGFSFTWRGDLHPTSYVPCPAHTSAVRRRDPVASTALFARRPIVRVRVLVHVPVHDVVFADFGSALDVGNIHFSGVELHSCHRVRERVPLRCERVRPAVPAVVLLILFLCQPLPRACALPKSLSLSGSVSFFIQPSGVVLLAIDSQGVRSR